VAAEKKGTRIKHEWFQSVNFVEIGIFARNIKREQVEVSAQEQSLSVHVKLSADETYALDLELCDTIVPEKTEVECLPPKVEIKLHKKNLVKWTALERASNAPVPVQAWADTSQVDKNKYPSSSKKTIDWGAIDKTIEEDKLEGDAALNKVFQDIFKNGSEEQRRAMMKSFVESGGTVLSTNWDEVGKGEVDLRPLCAWGTLGSQLRPGPARTSSLLAPRSQTLTVGITHKGKPAGSVTLRASFQPYF